MSIKAAKDALFNNLADQLFSRPQYIAFSATNISTVPIYFGIVYVGRDYREVTLAAARLCAAYFYHFPVVISPIVVDISDLHCYDHRLYEIYHSIFEVNNLAYWMIGICHEHQEYPLGAAATTDSWDEQPCVSLLPDLAHKEPFCPYFLPWN